MGCRTLRVLILVLLLATPSYAFDRIEVIGIQDFFDDVSLIVGETGPAGPAGGGFDTGPVEALFVDTFQEIYDSFPLKADTPHTHVEKSDVGHNHSDTDNEDRIDTLENRVDTAFLIFIDTGSVADTIENHTHANVADTDNATYINVLSDSILVLTDRVDTAFATFVDTPSVADTIQSHIHTGFADSPHTHVEITSVTDNITDTLGLKADTPHVHNDKADTPHTHSEITFGYDTGAIEALFTDTFLGKADTPHTHVEISAGGDGIGIDTPSVADTIQANIFTDIGREYEQYVVQRGGFASGGGQTTTTSSSWTDRCYFPLDIGDTDHQDLTGFSLPVAKIAFAFRITNASGTAWLRIWDETNSRVITGSDTYTSSTNEEYVAEFELPTSRFSPDDKFYSVQMMREGSIGTAEFHFMAIGLEYIKE